MHTPRLYTQKASARTEHNLTKAANHSSIFYAKMHKTLASFCKLQLMCVREKRQAEHAVHTKVERRSEWEQMQIRKTGRSKRERWRKRWAERKNRGVKRSEMAPFPGHILQDNLFFSVVLLWPLCSILLISLHFIYSLLPVPLFFVSC